MPTLFIHGEPDPLVAYERAIRLNKKPGENEVPYMLLIALGDTGVTTLSMGHRGNLPIKQ